MDRSSTTPAERPHRVSRPTILDQRFRGDAWVEGRDDMLYLYLGNYCLTAVRGLALDLPHLYQLFDRLRQGPPRGRA